VDSTIIVLLAREHGITPGTVTRGFSITLKKLQR
jgi:hypothetical protein